MKSSNYLLDTSVLIPYMKKEAKLLQHLPTSGTLYASVITFGELYYGAERSMNVAKELAAVHKFEKTLRILDVDLTVASTYSRIRQEQNKKGLMLPVNDLWIAATALRYGLTLVSRDKHFSWIDKLSLEQW